MTPRAIQDARCLERKGMDGEYKVDSKLSTVRRSGVLKREGSSVSNQMLLL
jgi:hypothetical protein